MKLMLEYTDKTSFIHNLDPRVKFLWFIGNLLLILFFQDLMFLSISIGLVLITTMLAEITLIAFLPLIKVIVIIGVQFVILQGLLRPEGPIILQFGHLSFYQGGFLVGLTGIMFLMVLAFLFLQFIMWTSPKELTLLLVKLGLPQKYAVLIGLALHFLPIIEKDLRTIYESQQARGLELATTWQKAKGLLPIMLPLILRALKRAKEVALSMELKGYTRFSNRTFLYNLAFAPVDYLVFSALFIYFSGWIVLRTL